MEICYEVEASAHYEKDGEMEVPNDVVAEGESAVRNYIAAHAPFEEAVQGLKDKISEGNECVDVFVDFEE